MSSLSSTSTAFDQDSVDAGKTGRNEQVRTRRQDFIHIQHGAIIYDKFIQTLARIGLTLPLVSRIFP